MGVEEEEEEKVGGEATPLLSGRSDPSASGGHPHEPAPHLLNNFDQALAHIGSYGVWQAAVVGLLWLPAGAGGVIVLLWSFTGLEPKAFRCLLPECDRPGAAGFDDPDPAAFFRTPEQPDYCEKPVLDPDAFNSTGIRSNATGDASSSSLFSSAGGCSLLSRIDVVGFEPCEVRGGGGDDVVYAPFEYESTFVTELDLVCEDQYKVALVGTFYMVGLFLGSLLGSYPADRYGRKVMIFLFVWIGGVANLIGAFLNEYWSYLFFRTLCGVGEMGMVMVSFTLSVELVGVRQQAFVGNMNQLSFAVGQIVCGVLAYFIRDWRILHLASSACVLPLVLLWFIIPESPRWLIARKKWKRLGKVLRTAQKINRKKIPEWLIVPKTIEEEEEYLELLNKNNWASRLSLTLTSTSSSSPSSSSSSSPSKSSHKDQNTEPPPETLSWPDLIRQPVLRPRIIVMAINWALVSMVYYGIGMSMTVLGGDIFVNFILSAVFEIIGYVICILVSDHWGRKPVIVVNFLACGVACLISGFIPDSNPAKIPLVLIGKLGSSGAFSTAYVYTAELFPTPVRGTAVGACSTVGRVGSAAAPQLALFLPTVTFDALPLVIFGVAGLFGGLLSLLLPETLGQPLPDSTWEASAASDGGKRFFEWWTSRQLREAVERNERRIKNALEDDE